jgi:hypothetical protein
MMANFDCKPSSQARSIVDQFLQASLAAGLPSPEAYTKCLELGVSLIYERGPKVAYRAVGVRIDICKQ